MLSSPPPFLLVFLPIQHAYSLAVNTSPVLYAPVTAALSAAANLTTTDPTGACENLNTCRSLHSIVQTCLATIFACVLVAVHRNIPAPKHKTKYGSNPAKNAVQWLWSKTRDQKQSVIVFVVTLLAPEWVLAWAIRQALRARKLARELEEARTHAAQLCAVSHSELAAERGANTVEDEEIRGTGVTPRTSPDEELALIRIRPASSSTSTSHVAPQEDQIECT